MAFFLKMCLTHYYFLAGAFLVPYLLMLVVLGIPLLYMELTVGQYTRRGPVLALATVCPLLKGALTKFWCPVLKMYSGEIILMHVLSDLRSGNCIGGHLLHYVYLLQCRHHLGSLLPLQLLPGTTTMAKLQQYLEHT